MNVSYRPIVTVLVAAPSIAQGFRIGSDFMPQLDEGSFLLQTVLPAEAALEEVDRLNHRVEDVLRGVPEVEDVVRRNRAGAAHGRSDASHDLRRAGRAQAKPHARLDKVEK